MATVPGHSAKPIQRVVSYCGGPVLDALVASSAAYATQQVTATDTRYRASYQQRGLSNGWHCKRCILILAVRGQIDSGDVLFDYLAENQR